VNETVEPAATATVVVLPPVLAPTLHRRSFEDSEVTGELLFVFVRTFWYFSPLTPLAVRYWKMSAVVMDQYDDG
jgi:hypothetical protein